MSVVLAVVVLTLVVVAGFGVALLPALLELRRRTDVAPLRIRRGGGDVRHFARGFHAFVEAELAARAVDAPQPPPGGGAIALRDGQPAWLVTGRPATLPVAWMPAQALESHVVLSEVDLAVPAGVALLKELYVAGALTGGDDASYRAVLAGGDATLGAASQVLRWIDAGGTLRVGARSVLHGRASAGGELWLGEGVRFERVAAPVIRFATARLEGDAATVRAVPIAPPVRHPALMTPPMGMATIPTARPSVVQGTRTPLEPPPGVIESFGRWLIDGDFAIPDGEYVPMDLVVTGTLAIGAGARVLGAVKAAILTGGPGAIYSGAIIATDRLELAAGSVVAGPVVVEGEAVLGDGSRIGTVDEPTTISAVVVRMGRESSVCGEVWARGEGRCE